jgi:hypothetical protein
VSEYPKPLRADGQSPWVVQFETGTVMCQRCRRVLPNPLAAAASEGIVEQLTNKQVEDLGIRHHVHAAAFLELHSRCKEQPEDEEVTRARLFQ